MPTGPVPLQVACVPLTETSLALQLATRKWPAADRALLLELVKTDSNHADDRHVLVEAKRGGLLLGAVLAQLVPGNAAIVSPPQLMEPQPLVASAMLLDELCRELVERQIAVAQALVDSEALLDAEHLQAGGFKLLADLNYLQWTIEDRDRSFPTASQSLPSVAMHAVGADDTDRLARVIERTYVGTHDCPELDGARSTDEVLEAYRAVGEHRPELWFLVGDGDEDAGCLILANHPDQRQWEVVYVGLAPEHRGRGLAQAAIAHAKRLAAVADCERLVLAVDGTNQPALKLYQSCGFETWDRRSVYWKSLRDR